MVGWKEKTLGEVTSFITKGIPPKYSDYESESTIWVLNQKCNRNFEISYVDARLHDYNFKKVPENKMLMNGDVLINSTGTGTAGRVAQLQNINKPTTIDGHMILLRPTDDIDPLYYGYAIKSCQSQIEGLAEGSTGQTELNRKRLQEEVIIRYPVDKQEQKAIAYLLSDLDEKIKINVKINNNLPTYPFNAMIAAKQCRQTPKTDECLHTDGKVSDRGDNEETAEQFSSLLAA